MNFFSKIIFYCLLILLLTSNPIFSLSTKKTVIDNKKYTHLISFSYPISKEIIEEKLMQEIKNKLVNKKKSLIDIIILIDIPTKVDRTTLDSLFKYLSYLNDYITVKQKNSNNNIRIRKQATIDKEIKNYQIHILYLEKLD